MSALPRHASAASIFSEIDTDGSGTIEKSELLTYLLKFHVDPNEISAIFSRCKPSGEGITPAEWAAAYESGVLSALFPPQEDATFHRITKIPIEPDSMASIVEIANGEEFTAGLRGLGAALKGVELLFIGKDEMMVHSRWAMPSASNVEVLGGMLHTQLQKYVAGPAEPVHPSIPLLAPIVGPPTFGLETYKLEAAGAWGLQKAACRVTTMPLGGAEEVPKLLEFIKSKEEYFRSELDGLLDLACFLGEDSVAVACASYTSAAALEKATPKVAKVLMAAAPLLHGKPDSIGANVGWRWARAATP